MARLILGTIIGGITSTRANLWARANRPGRLRAWLGQKEDLSDAWLAGESQPLAAEDGFAGDDYLFNGIGKVATSLAEYRAVYASAFAQPSFRNLLSSLPAFMILDDHEVDDDWTWTDSQRALAQIPIWDRLIRRLKGRPQIEWQLPRQRVQDALQAYWEHQGMHAPPFALPLSLDSRGQYSLEAGDPGSLAYSFTFGAAAFFVLDTRTSRVKSRTETSMLGEGQWKVLEKWLQEVKDTFPVKFLVTSCNLLFPMWLDIARDRWQGFPKERDRLLHFLAAHNIDGVYLLAGDMHSAYAICADLYVSQDRMLPLWEFCASPIDQTPNRLASRTYWPLGTELLKRQRLFFCVRQHSFGLVRVDFSKSDSPQVRFEVYGETGELLGEVNNQG